MNTSQAIGLIETSSIAIGFSIADTVLKAANVEIIVNRTICPGKYMVLIGGTVDAVQTSVDAGVRVGAHTVGDHFVISSVHPEVFPAISGVTHLPELKALGVLESFSVASTIQAADAAVKSAPVKLIAIHIAMASGGKAFLTLTGEGAAVLEAIAVGAGLFALPGDGGVFQGFLPTVLDMVLSGLIWLWFVNLFNFMDGIDGIAGSQTATAGLGLFILAILFSNTAGLGPYGLALAAVALGFLPWNWQPARIFLGDVGSVPLGYALGWLLLSLAVFGLWQAALLLVLYFLADTTFTLLRRLVRGKVIWRAHQEHYYQYAVEAGRSHAHVAVVVTGVNLVLAGLALSTTVSTSLAWGALGAGILLTAVLLWYLRFFRIRAVHAD